MFLSSLHYQFSVVSTQHLPSLTLTCCWPYRSLGKSSPSLKSAFDCSLPSSFTVLQTTVPVVFFRQYFLLLCQLSPQPPRGLPFVVLREGHPAWRWLRVPKFCDMSTSRREFVSSISAQTYWFNFLPDELPLAPQHKREFLESHKGQQR